jgi:apolipoprotein N-acyltransferase
MGWLSKAIPHKRQFWLSVSGGLILAGSLAPSPLGCLSWVGLAPVIWALWTASPLRSAGCGLVAGGSFGLVLLYWIAALWVPATVRPLLFLGVLLLVVYLGIYGAAFGWGFSIVRRRWGPRALALVPFLWTGLEFIRSQTFLGFPWGTLAYSQTGYLAVIQIASVLGTPGISFWIVSINALLALVVVERRRTLLMSICIMGLVLWIVLPLLWGRSLLQRPLPSQSVTVGIVQPNINPAILRYGVKEERLQILREMTLSIAHEQPDLVVWSESAYPGWLSPDSKERADIRKLAREMGAPILLGSIDVERRPSTKDYVFYNAAELVALEPADDQTYRKIRLVLFGERLPFDDVLPVLRKIDLGQGNYSPGSEFVIMSTEGHSFAPLICFESIFPDLVKRFVDRGAEFLVNITEDSWYGRTSGPYQHAQMAVLRSVEYGIGLARCGNAGISMIVDQKGRILKRTDLFTRCTLVGQVPIRSVSTFYSRHGDWFGWLCVGISLFMIMLTRLWPLPGRRIL